MSACYQNYVTTNVANTWVIYILNDNQISD